MADPASDSAAEVAHQAAADHATIAKSATVMTASAAVQASSADRNTQLAADRTVLAAERTYAAWVRTGLASLASGIGARALLEGVVPDWLALIAGGTLVLFSAFCFIAAVWRELRPRYLNLHPDVQHLPAPLLFLMNGILVLVSIAAFAGLLLAD